jgi:putative ABC transport system substrate-binding protein
MKKITRRSFLKASAACAAALGLSACGASSAAGSSAAANGSSGAAAGGTAFKVGIVNYVDDASLNQIVASVESELDELAKKNGCTFNYADYYSNAQADQSTLNQIATELVADKVDAIVAIATPTAKIMAAQTEEIPIIYAAVSDPEGAGLTGIPNVTGTSDALDTESILKLVTAANPNAKTIGLLYDLSQDASTQPIAAAKAYCDKNGLAYVEKNGTTTTEVQQAAEALIAAKVDAVFTPTDNTIMTAELSIYEKFAEAGIPHYAGADSFALNGAFCGYGVDYVQLGVATADMVGEVLCGGKAPSDLPFETFDNGIATVNSEICTQLGYNFDDIKAAFTPYCTGVEEITTAEAF